MDKRKLSILIYSLASGGAERVVSILLNELKDKYNLTLVLMNDTISYDIPTDLKITYLENSNPKENGIKKLFKLLFLGYKYKQICNDNNIDISLSFMNRPNYINSISRILGNKSKIIISERAMPSSQHKVGLQGRINRFLIKSFYNKADIVIANSKGNSFDLKENFNIKNIYTIYNPIKIKIYKQEKQNKFIFITIGRMDEGKNHKLLIESFIELNIKNTELWLVGDGSLRKDLKKLSNENIKFLGRQKDVFKYLSQADCFVFSSNYEGFPNVLLEAMNCNLPIISTDCKSGPRELLAPNSDIRFQIKDDIELAEYGILTPVNSKNNMIKAMTLIINDSKLRDKYKDIAYQRVKYFNKITIINEWIKILN